ncbi:MAG: lipid-A-disaccharide synthase [Phycisphaerales bacterium]|nr:lipid-A-disaccharide synthase [Phycisphaerales bacterium]
MSDESHENEPAAETPLRVFISVAEESADMHAAALVRAARSMRKRWEFRGLTGPRLRDLGVETVFDMASHAAMLAGVLGVVRRGMRAMKAVRADWEAHRPDVAVLLDSPELHLPLARVARRMNIPVLYYIAPQTWASRAYRNRKIAAVVDRLACILPFEEQYFRDNGVKAEFVGHPLFESLALQVPDETRVTALRESAPIVATTSSSATREASARPPLIALLPGSRKHVIRSIAPLQLETARLMAEKLGSLRVAVSAVSAERSSLIEEIVRASGVPAEIVINDNASLLTAADFVLVASGTATLHVAHYRKPMVVMYDAGRLMGLAFRLFGGRVIKTPHLSLVNILANERIVPEFMPLRPRPAEVAEAATAILTDARRCEAVMRRLDEVVRPIKESRASDRVCGLIEELAGAGPALSN